jgi:hypothetical protein
VTAKRKRRCRKMVSMCPEGLAEVVEDAAPFLPAVLLPIIAEYAFQPPHGSVGYCEVWRRLD